MSEKKKDILILSQFFYPEYATSALLSTDLAFGLAKAGFSVDCICGFPQEFTGDGTMSPANETVNGVKIHRVRYVQTSRKGIYGRIVNYLSFYLSMMANLPRMAKYRLIIAYTNPPLLPRILVRAIRLFRCRGMFISFDVYPEIAVRTGVTSPNSLMARTMNSINRKVFKYVDTVVALSCDMKDFLLNNRTIGKTEIKVIPNWHTDLIREFNLDITSHPLSESGVFNVGYFGNMGTCQDMKTILNTMKIFRPDKDVKFIYGGLGVKKDAVRSRCQEYGNGDFKGFLSGKNYAENLLSCDVLIVSLEKAAIGLGVPSKTYAYFMAGRPVIAVMDDCDLAHLITDNECGFTVKNGDTEGLYNAINKLKNDPELSRKMGENSRRIYEKNYTLEKGIENYTGVISELLKKQ